MATMVKEAKKEKKQPVANKAAIKPGNNFYTYIQMVEKKAYELYEKRGRKHGQDQDDWFEAQKLVEDDLSKA
jgi:hypothetical protein